MDAAPTIDTVRELGRRYSNWGRWGSKDELGTLNHVQPQDIVAAARLVRTGRTVGMGLAIDDAGPQSGGGGFGRFNPIHLMIRDGADIAAGTAIRDFHGGEDRYLRGTDDILILRCKAELSGMRCRTSSLKIPCTTATPLTRSAAKVP